MVGKHEGKRQIRRPRRENNIRMDKKIWCEGGDGIHLARRLSRMIILHEVS